MKVWGEETEKKEEQIQEIKQEASTEEPKEDGAWESEEKEIKAKLKEISKDYPSIEDVDLRLKKIIENQLKGQIS